MASQALHMRIGLTRGIVRPSAIKIASGRGAREPDGSAPISTARGMFGGLVVSLAMWAGIIYLVL